MVVYIILPPGGLEADEPLRSNLFLKSLIFSPTSSQNGGKGR